MEQLTATEIAKELGYVLAEPGLVDPLRYPAHVLYRLADPKEGGIVIWQPAAQRVLELVKKGLDAQFREEQPKQTSRMYCSCDEATRDWYGIAPVSNSGQPEREALARAYIGLVLCGVCGCVAPWRGEPVGQLGVSSAARILARRVQK